MESFFSLRAEKQEHIINAALVVFGRNGYKKASIADIAGEAGIAKGMVMYYFGSKKNLYLYLVNLCAKVVMGEIEAENGAIEREFFGRIKMVTEIKIGVMKKHPAINSFLASVFYETDKEVLEDLEEFKNQGFEKREQMITEGTDVSNFKEDVDPKLLSKYLLWASKGLEDEILKGGGDVLDRVDPLIEEFYALLDLLQRHLYKH